MSDDKAKPERIYHRNDVRHPRREAAPVVDKLDLVDAIRTRMHQDNKIIREEKKAAARKLQLEREQEKRDAERQRAEEKLAHFAERYAHGSFPPLAAALAHDELIPRKGARIYVIREGSDGSVAMAAEDHATARVSDGRPESDRASDEALDTLERKPD